MDSWIHSVRPAAPAALVQPFSPVPLAERTPSTVNAVFHPSLGSSSELDVVK
ncbi:hypothetical protein [Kutzneria sp. NPDC051319]|uniref:hypothetical protein n=1 Tax=Kutzneria sp. NPDC051319 TaxID=3155047 RepID=UPI00341C8540